MSLERALQVREISESEQEPKPSSRRMRNLRFYEKATKPLSVSEVRDGRLRFNDQGARQAQGKISISQSLHIKRQIIIYTEI